MRRLLLFVMLLILSVSTMLAQKKKRKETPEPPKQSSSLYLKMYENALRYNDLNSAITAVHLLLADNPQQNKSYKDTLAYLYFSAGRFPQVISLSEELLKERPNDTMLLEMVALSYQNLGDIKSALSYYEKLYKLTNSLRDLYNVASLQYYLQRIGEAKQSVSKIISDPRASKVPIEIVTSPQQKQQTNLMSAAYNILGILLMSQKEYDEAEKAFKSALQYDPNFKLPQGNLELLAKLKKQNAKEEQKDK